jgi:hypothetical protein
MKHRKLLPFSGMVAVMAVVFRQASRTSCLDGGIDWLRRSDATRLRGSCSFFHHPHTPLWQRFDPTCPQCL